MTESRWVAADGRGWRGYSRGLLGVTDTFTGLIVVMALQVYIYGKTYYIVHFKYCMSLIPRQRCLKKVKVYTLQSE